MMKWLPFELHSHSHHSDGDYSPQELLEHMQNMGMCGTVLTDHNTNSGHQEFIDAIKSDYPHMIGICGLEWTTYYGHMLVIGENGYTDWRGVKPDEIDTSLAKIRSNGGIVGIAHPYAISNPIKTGYRWSFEITKWENLNFLEVWSRHLAPIEQRSKFAMTFWTHLLNLGYRVSATSGRDYHRPLDEGMYYSNTFLGFKDKIDEKSAYDAILNGRMCISTGNILTMTASKNEKVVNIGDETPEGDYVLKLSFIDVGAKLITPTKPMYLRIVANGQVICQMQYKENEKYEFKTHLYKGWIRAELVGTYLQTSETILAFTNPIYVD